ncbi:DUF2381 family protein [Archangium sp.]|uniref:DUF2381 family protein n=1 Tax=Archangium sp. TaxID=1872627 RepID=UPI002D2FE461|nr:DUF2381 family protein [Archangium sp.]HYO60233.1 DUF2381 family protein [Archangium sp.]
MLPTLCGLLSLLITLSADPPDIPSSQVISPEPRSRQVVIPEVTSTPAQRVRAAPGFTTTFRFDTPLDPAAFVLEKREELFTLVEVGAYTVTLEPRAVLPETGLPLTVGFADGRRPAQASFTLVPTMSEVDVQVRVVRPPHPGEAPQARPEDTRAPYEPGLLAKLVLSGRMGRGGVTFKRLLNDGKTIKGDEVSIVETTVHRAAALAAVAVKLKLSPAATKPWVPGEAWLLDAQGGVVGRFPVWMDEARLAPGEERTVALEVELAPGAAPSALRLELREKDGGRTVRVGDLEL